MAPGTFRSAFTFASKEVTNWFPGHMVKGMRQLQQRLKDVDCIIEVHDARIPFSGRNHNFRDALLIRPHILLLNKSDLVDNNCKTQVQQILKSQGVNHVMYTNCKDNKDRTLQKLLPNIISLIENSPRFHRDSVNEFNLMVIGVPNVGKSTLINTLRQRNLKKGGKATKVAPHAGVTRSVLERIRISSTPNMYLYDSPGILAPNVKNIEVGMKLALCATLQDHLVGEDIIADFLLFWLNKHGYFKYVEQYGLKEPTDNILDLLYHIAIQNKLISKIRSPEGPMVLKPNFLQAANVMLRNFRSGALGRIMLDEDVLSTAQKQQDLNKFVRN